MQYTENLNLPLFETDDAVDLFTTYNAAMETLDEAVEEKATSADVDAVEQIANAAGATATQAQADATAAGTAAASAGTTAASAQADATQALSDAAAASTAAAGAATTAAAAEALAQQAIAAGLKVKQLSYNEITSIIALAGGATGIGSFAHIYATYASYVINLTPRIKLVAIGVDLRINSGSSFTAGTYNLRTTSSPPYINNATYSFVPFSTIDVKLKANPGSSLVSYSAEITPPASPANLPIFVSIVGIITYNQDIDLGTDIA